MSIWRKVIRIDFHHETVSTGEVHESSGYDLTTSSKMDCSLEDRDGKVGVILTPFNWMQPLHCTWPRNDWQMRQGRWQRPQKRKRSRGGKQ